VLQHTYRFVPASSKEGTDIELYPPAAGSDRSAVRVYSDKKCLQGVFSPRDRKREGILVCTDRPEERGRTIRINARLVGPTESVYDSSSMLQPPREVLRCDVDGVQLNAILLGR
jgi:hypothetical protein